MLRSPFPNDRLRMTLLIAFLALLIPFLFLIRVVVTPLLGYILLLLLLYPLRDMPLARYLAGILSLMFLLWFAVESRGILTPFVLAFGMAYLFDPLVRKLESIGMTRWLSALLIVLLVLGILSSLMIFLVPEVVDQLSELVNLSVKYSRLASDWIESEGIRLLTRTLKLDYQKLQDFLLTQVPDKIQGVFQTLAETAINVTGSLSRLIGQLLNLVLTPVLFFYLLKDFGRVKAYIRSLVPDSSRSRTYDYVDRIDKVIGGFFRGQLIVCLFVALLTGSLLMLFGIRYALILGLIAGILNIIPYVGLLITLAIGVLIGLLSPDPLISCLKIILIIEGIQILEGNLLSPRIVGDRVGLHPVWVIFSILVFSHFMGFFGLLIAVPTAAVFRIFAADALARIRKPDDPASPPAPTASEEA